MVDLFAKHLALRLQMLQLALLLHDFRMGSLLCSIHLASRLLHAML
jgi:hypothetical protein